jgi:hypothetical protein
MQWPRSGKTVYVHVLTTAVRKLYRCQVVIVRHSLDAPLSQARFWASSDLEGDAQTLLAHIATRWDIEVLFGDGKEELGLDHYQVMSATAILRFWTLAMLAYVFLEEEQHRLQQQWQRPVTMEKLAAKSSVASVAWCFSGSLSNSKLAFNLTPCMIYSPPEAA